MDLNPVLEAFNLTSAKLTPLSGGLINATWKIETDTSVYILQRINHGVFKSPQKIDENISRIASYLKDHHPDYYFVSPISGKDGHTLVHTADGYFRLMPFVDNSVTLHTVTHASQAYEAARQFGKFTKLLSGFDASTLQITIPDFHNLSLRYEQFNTALAQGNPGRIEETREVIDILQDYRWIVDEFEAIRKNVDFRIRVTHHDTKISNVLFDKDGKGICVIDLDTVMPGYFISDVGDMIRTYVSPANEEERDFDKIRVRDDVMDALTEGYLEFMGDELTATEKKHTRYSGMFMTYMQALRFLTDYLNDDVYYGARYDGHNRVRAMNQVRLLSELATD
ncbi:MAG: aminoglycoside phosphotransferase family protein [Cyclobacteriaceae bacterium]|jgi:Ser/Thr protein kinase RdoA (MazF antagonist)|nr:aminoglycoside phosphotransferase family protein [Cyclobacteriaceae bacterium]